MRTPDPHHPDMVSRAIQDGLYNIDVLRELVKAKDKNEAIAILTAYDPHLKFKPGEVDIFWASLTTGVMEMDAKGLVDYYDHLESKAKPPQPVKGTSPPREWNP